MPRKMLPADVLVLWAQKDREIRKAPNPPSRRQPHVTRHASRRQRTVSGQSINEVKAIYTPEGRWSETPIYVGDEKDLTRDVGPHDLKDPFNPAKSTTTATGEFRYDRPERRTQVRRSQGPKRRKAEDWIKLADEYLQ
jgi:hypothetical protein